MTYGPERTDLDGFRHLLHTRFVLRRVTVLNVLFWRIEIKQNFPKRGGPKFAILERFFEIRTFSIDLFEIYFSRNFTVMCGGERTNGEERNLVRLKLRFLNNKRLGAARPSAKTS